MRAQSTLDFAIGISVFLITVTVVFSFVPGTVQPFDGGDPDTAPFASRVATQVAGGVLGIPGSPPAFDLPCTREFFRAIPTGQPTCQFDQTVDVPGQRDAALTARLGVGAGHGFAIGLSGDLDDDGTRERLCWDDPTGRLLERGDGDCDPTAGDTELSIATGTPPSKTGSVSVASRVVSLGGRDVVLEVASW